MTATALTRVHGTLHALQVPIPYPMKTVTVLIDTAGPVTLIDTALDTPEATGPINGTAPNPVRNYDFSKELAKAVGRKYLFIPFGPPDAMLNLVLGEVAQVVTKGQKVLPKKAQQLGYRFQFPELPGALANLFEAGSGTPSAAKPEAVGASS